MTDFLTNEAEKFCSISGITSPPDLAEKLYTVTNWFSFMREEKMKGIRMDIVRIFVENGIQTSADFKNWTEKEILALKGIGPVTVQKLKGNGIRFKKR